MRRRRMTPILVFVITLFQVSTAHTEGLEEGPGRTAAARYVASAGTSVAPTIYWSGSPAGNIGAVDFEVRPGEHFISVRVADGAGLPVHGEIGADLDGIPQTSEMIASFCGRTDEPIEIPDVTHIQVAVRSGSCDGGPALATSGRVRIRFSAIP
jgi:hypothetical protein